MMLEKVHFVIKIAIQPPLYDGQEGGLVEVGDQLVVADHVDRLGHVDQEQVFARRWFLLIETCRDILMKII